MMWTIKKGYYRLVQLFVISFSHQMTKGKPKVLAGPGNIKNLYKELKSEGVGKPLIVTDKGIIKIKLLDGMLQTFEENNIEYIVFDDVAPNPTINMVETAKDTYLENNCDCMIGFGGGSPIDCAKIALGLAAKPGKTVKDLGMFFAIKGVVPPFFAVPTTAGTGTETNFGAIITDSDNRCKFAIASKKLLAKCVVLDPELSLGLPPQITAATGMDALTHAVESYINIVGGDFGNENAIKAVKIIFEHLASLYENGNQIEAREEMTKAAYYAGLAMNVGLLGYAHAIAHKLGGMYNISHGLANAVILPHVLDYYGEKVYKKLSKLAIAARIGDETESKRTLAERFIQAIRNMNEKMNIPSSIKEITDDDIDIIAKAAYKETHPMYPVPKFMKLEDLREIIAKLKSC
ncbi:MAG: iron-containing alcohol dehydrogenase [Promethearchaeota archaeon]